MSQNSHDGHVLAVLELPISPGSFALLLSITASVSSQGIAPEPHLTQFVSLLLLPITEV